MSIVMLLADRSLEHSKAKETHTFVKRHLDFFHRISESRYSVEALRLESLRNKHEINISSDTVRAVIGNVEKFTCIVHLG